MARQLLAAAAAPGVSPGPPTRLQTLTSQWPARGESGRARPGLRAPQAGGSPGRGSSGPARVGRRQDAAPGRGPVEREQGARRRRGGPRALQPPRRAHLCRPRHRALCRRPATPPLPPSPALRPRPGPISPNPEKKVLRRRARAHPVTTAWHGSPAEPAALEQPPAPRPRAASSGRGSHAGKAHGRPRRSLSPALRPCRKAAPCSARLCCALRQLRDAGHGGFAAREEGSSSSALPCLCWPQLSARFRARRGAQGCGVGPGKRGSCRGRVGRADRQWRLTQGHLWAPPPFVPG